MCIRFFVQIAIQKPASQIMKERRPAQARSKDEGPQERPGEPQEEPPRARNASQQATTAGTSKSRQERRKTATEGATNDGQRATAGTAGARPDRPQTVQESGHGHGQSQPERKGRSEEGREGREGRRGRSSSQKRQHFAAGDRRQTRTPPAGELPASRGAEALPGRAGDGQEPVFCRKINSTLPEYAE